MNKATTAEPRTVMTVAAAVVVVLAVIWALAMGHLISIPLPLVWILPFLCIVIVALAVLWVGGLR